MKNLKVRLITAAVAMMLGTTTAMAADTDTANTPIADSAVDSKWSFGMQAAPLIFGLSLRYRPNDLWQFQGVLQPAGDDLSGAVRILRDATQKQYWRSYLFAGLAHSQEGTFTTFEETAATAGMGVEWSWSAKNPSLPPLSWALELGLGYGSRVIDFDIAEDETEDEFFVAVGASIHYHFE